jgi:hypothetical protein
MFCTECGVAAVEGGRFCVACGTPVLSEDHSTASGTASAEIPHPESVAAKDAPDAEAAAPKFSAHLQCVKCYHEGIYTTLPSYHGECPRCGTVHTWRGRLEAQASHMGISPSSLTGLFVVFLVSICVAAGSFLYHTSTVQQALETPADRAAARQAGAAAARQRLLERIWNAYVNMPGNAGQGERELNVTPTSFESGSVSPKAMNTSVQSRLPAYLACYDFISVLDGLGDSKATLCIYFIANDAIGTHAVMWRGKDNLYEIRTTMAEDDFRAD